MTVDQTQHDRSHPKRQATLRPLTVEDEPLLWLILMYAAHETSLEAVHQSPALVRYLQNWGRVGDRGWVAEVRSEVVGAAWVRCWPGSDKGYGYVADDVPELAIAVVPEYQGLGIGTRLLTAIKQDVQQNHYAAMSLSVRADNPAMQLYKRFGFVPMENSSVPNRVGGTSLIMLCEFSSQ